jgi:membrane-associated phospholipid phosphatase
VLAHVGAQPAFLLFPTEPPRVLDGFVDTLSEVSGLDLEHPLLVRFYNPVAAMPSLHLAFATLTAAAIADRLDSRAGRAVAYAYPPLVALVVTATGNHYVLDSAAGAVLGATARWLA